MLSIRTYYKYRELIWSLVVADLKSKYKNSALGFFWSMLDPLLISIVMIFVFMHVFDLRMENYPLYLISGLMTWRFFNSTASTMRVIRGYSGLIRKIYFPKEILVLSACLSSLISTLFEFVVLFIISIVLGGNITGWIVLTPLVLLLLFVMVIGFSFALSTLYVFYEDMQHIWNVVLRALFYATPIIYPATRIAPDSPYYIIFILNPMSHFVITIRHLIMYGDSPALGSVIGMLVFSIIAYVAGFIIFKRYEARLPEEV